MPDLPETKRVSEPAKRLTMTGLFDAMVAADKLKATKRDYSAPGDSGNMQAVMLAKDEQGRDANYRLSLKDGPNDGPPTLMATVTRNGQTLTAQYDTKTDGTPPVTKVDPTKGKYSQSTVDDKGVVKLGAAIQKSDAPIIAGHFATLTTHLASKPAIESNTFVNEDGKVKVGAVQPAKQRNPGMGMA